MRRGVAAGIATCAALALAACGSSASSSPSTGTSSPSSSASNPLAGGAPKGTVVVGSANFPEDELLAQIYVLALQGAGVKVTPKFNIGAREVYYPEIEKGAVTVIPEYNGALLTTSVDTKSTAATTAEVDSQLKAKLPSSLEILNPSPAQDKDSVTVTQAFARQHHLTSISQLGPIAKTMIIGGPPEFKTRSDGLVGLKKNYGLTFKNFT
ncbi:MAG TPA: ABC transporter substrate-binding protein, partial [Streptosporangiaceae bacterium]|nr:ABC transporter substrate-binding protein [Streptosporangiaceae bacterium]